MIYLDVDLDVDTPWTGCQSNTERHTKFTPMHDFGWREEAGLSGEHANCTQEGPGRSWQEGPGSVADLNPGHSCCEATVQTSHHRAADNDAYICMTTFLCQVLLSQVLISLS